MKNWLKPLTIREVTAHGSEWREERKEGICHSGCLGSTWTPFQFQQHSTKDLCSLDPLPEDDSLEACRQQGGLTVLCCVCCRFHPVCPDLWECLLCYSVSLLLVDIWVPRPHIISHLLERKHAAGVGGKKALASFLNSFREKNMLGGW